MTRSPEPRLRYPGFTMGEVRWTVGEIKFSLDPRHFIMLTVILYLLMWPGFSLFFKKINDLFENALMVSGILCWCRSGTSATSTAGNRCTVMSFALLHIRCCSRPWWGPATRSPSSSLASSSSPSSESCTQSEFTDTVTNADGVG